MNRPDPAWLIEITAPAEKWRRRCNGRPADGIPVTRYELRVVLAASVDVKLTPEGFITWRAADNGISPQFTAKPVQEEP